MSTVSDPSAGVEPTVGRRAYNVPAAEKVLDLLEYASGISGGATATEIAAGAGRSVHEIYRVLQVLEARGYLYRPTGSDRYHLSMKLFELAHRVPQTRALCDAALPIMQELAPACLQSCHLGVLSGADVLIVLQIDPPLSMGWSVRLGARFPFEKTSSGLVLYAHAAAPDRAALDNVVAERGGAEGVAVLHRQRDEVLVQGRDVRRSLQTEGVTNISVPITDHLGHAIAALTCPYIAQAEATVPLEDVIARTEAAGRALSRRLGAGTSGAASQPARTITTASTEEEHDAHDS